MLARIINFLIGAVLAGGGGYLVWTQRAAAPALFPPGPEGAPWLLIAGLLGTLAGVVFLATAVIPRPKRAARIAAAAAERKARLGAAENYYANATHPADRDWRSGDLPPAPKPQPASPSEPVLKPEPVLKAVSTPEPLLKSAQAAPEPLLKPAPAAPPEPLFKGATAAPQAPLFAAPEMPAPAPAPARPKPVATSIPPEESPFPAMATLAPIPRATEMPAAVPPAATAPAAAVAAAPSATTPAFDAIRAAIAEGRLEEADKILTIERDKAQGEALAELTGLAGDHAAAAGRQSNAKWLWRLALKRFGECNAMNSPAAKAVVERLRLSDN